MTETWTKEDSAKARAQGWDLFEIWDGRIELMVQATTLTSDEAARLFVEHGAKNNDELCKKAALLAFRSRMPDFDEVIKNTKQRRRQK